MTKVEKAAPKKMKAPKPSTFPASPLRPVIATPLLEARIEALLDEFYGKRIAALDTIDPGEGVTSQEPVFV